MLHFSYLKNNPDGHWKAIKFEWGLRHEIRDKVSTLEIKDFATLVNKCRIAKNSYLEMEFEKERHNFLKRKRVAKIQTKNNFKNKVNPRKDKQIPAREPLPLCNNYGKSHGSKPCLFGQNICYQCKKPRHYAKDCNTEKPLNNLMPRPQTKGRVFTLSREYATQSSDMIKGIYFLKNALLIALFDSVAMHSFISIDCMKKLKLPLSSLPFDLLVSTFTRGKVSIYQTCLNSPILIEGKPFVIALVCLFFIGIDIIIRMDWLSTNDIISDCSRRLAYFPNNLFNKQKSSDSLFLTATQVEKCLLEGAQGFLLYSLNLEID